MFNQKRFLLFLIFFLSFSTRATTEKYFLVTPHCLLKNIQHTDYKTIAKTDVLALISTTQIENFAEAKHIQAEKPCGGFINVTEEWLKNHKNAKTFLKGYEMPSSQSFAAETYSIQYPNQVNQVLNQFNQTEMWNDLTQFTQFPDRYMNSATGAKAATWLQNKIMEITKQNNRDDVSTYTIASGTLQNSVVVKIGNSSEPGIVIGAHMDTYPAGRFNTKPGADDDGSGCMTVMGIARTLLESGMHFKKPIYIIWYAAEEFGLIGSKAVVNDFIAKKIPVSAVLQFDMTGYAYRNEDTMWLVTDFVNPGLTEYLSKLITAYVKKDVKKPVDITQCGYACSDHAIWMKNKIPAAFPFESRFSQHNPTIHQSTDTIATLSSAHMADYAKLGLAFAVELAEPVE